MNTKSTLWLIFAKVAFFLVISYLTFLLLSSPKSLPLLDGVNLLIHEAGHLIFILFGQMISILGGTLFQLLVPVSISLYFLLRKEYFSFAFTLFWIGDNLLNIGLYIKDARSMNLELLIAGSIHDWNWLLSRWGLLNQDQVIGGFVQVLAVISLLSCLLIMISTIILDIKSLIRQNSAV